MDCKLAAEINRELKKRMRHGTTSLALLDTALNTKARSFPCLEAHFSKRFTPEDQAGIAYLGINLCRSLEARELEYLLEDFYKEYYLLTRMPCPLFYRCESGIQLQQNYFVYHDERPGNEMFLFKKPISDNLLVEDMPHLDNYGNYVHSQYGRPKPPPRVAPVVPNVDVNSCVLLVAPGQEPNKPDLIVTSAYLNATTTTTVNDEHCLVQSYIAKLMFEQVK